MTSEEASESRTPYVDSALRFLGVNHSGASDNERCEHLLGVLTDPGLGFPGFMQSAEATGGPIVVPIAQRPSQTPRPTQYEELTYQGYREMQLLRRDGHDTLSDIDPSSICSVETLYEAVIGRAMRQESVFGSVETGPLTISGLVCQGWNESNKGKRFGAHDEVWQVRSHPKGRIGQKLVPGEIRKVTILNRSSQRHSTAGGIATIRLFLLPPAASISRPEVQRGQATYGVTGVSAGGIHLWEHRGRAFLAERDYPEGEGQFHAVYGGYALLVHKPTSGLFAGATIPQRMHCDFVHQFVLAGSIAGFAVSDRPMHRRGVNAVEQREWYEEKQAAHVRFCSGIYEAYPDREPATFVSRLVFGAVDVAEQTSLLGLLDKLADPFYDQGLPDDLLRPNGLILLLAVAVRIACNPSRAGLSVSTPDDVWASRSVCNLLESAHPCLVSADTSNSDSEKTRDVYLFATDLFLENTLTSLQSDLDVHEHERAMPKSTIDLMRQTTQNSLETLHYLGVAVCVDVCGVPSKQRDGTSGIYTEFGLARACCDPVQQTRTQVAYEAGLGNLAHQSPVTRTSTQSARQKALVRVFGCVEQWLQDGTHNGIVLPPRASASASARATELCVNKTYDEWGNVSNVSIRREPVPESVAAATSAAEALRDAKAKTATAAAPLSGNKKKQRAAAKRDAKATNHAAAGSRLGAKPAPGNRSRERVRAQRGKLCDEVLMHSSVVDGGELLSNILQQGVARGVTEAFDVQTFLVGRSSSIRCAHCERFVNVVQGVAFSGQLGRCPNCQHPRCLHCVDADIEAIDRNSQESDQKNGAACDADPQPVMGRDVFGCMFCDP